MMKLDENVADETRPTFMKPLRMMTSCGFSVYGVGVNFLIRASKSDLSWSDTAKKGNGTSSLVEIYEFLGVLCLYRDGIFR